MGEGGGEQAWEKGKVRAGIHNLALQSLTKLYFWCFCAHARCEYNSISFPELRSTRPAVGKRELWEHPFQACAIDTIYADCALRSETGCAEFGYFNMDAPRALVFRPLVKGSEALGARLTTTSPAYLRPPPLPHSDTI